MWLEGTVHVYCKEIPVKVEGFIQTFEEEGMVLTQPRVVEGEFLFGSITRTLCR